MSGTRNESSVSATQLVRDFSQVRQMAKNGPVHITAHGRNDLTILPFCLYEECFNSPVGHDANDDHEFNVIMETIETMVLVLDNNMIVRKSSRSFCEILGVDEVSIVGRPASFLATSAPNQFLLQSMKDVSKSRIADVLTMPSMQRPDRTFRITIKPLPTGIVVFAADITERIQARDRAQASAAMDRALSVIPGLGYANVRSCGMVLWSSIGFANLLGSSTDMLAGSRFQNLFDPACREIIENSLTTSQADPYIVEASYLNKGVNIRDCKLIINQFWSDEYHACAHVVIIDSELFCKIGNLSINGMNFLGDDSSDWPEDCRKNCTKSSQI